MKVRKIVKGIRPPIRLWARRWQVEGPTADPAGDTARTTERVRVRTRAEEQLSLAVAEEAQKMKEAQRRAQERREEQVEEGQRTDERARVMHDYSGGVGRQQGQGESSESSPQVPTTSLGPSPNHSWEGEGIREVAARILRCTLRKVIREDCGQDIKRI